MSSEQEERFAVAQVTPYAWESGHEVNAAISATAARLAARGHRVSIVAPSHSEEAVRRSRGLIRAGDGVGEPGEVRVLAVGEALGPAPEGTAARRRATLPIDVAHVVEELVGAAAFDLCHVYEPFAPSVASAALRHSRALNVGTFHAPTERVAATQVARKLVDLVLGRLDARLASFAATAELMSRHFPAEYRVITPGAGPVDLAPLLGLAPAAGSGAGRPADAEQAGGAAGPGGLAGGAHAAWAGGAPALDWPAGGADPLAAADQARAARAAAGEPVRIAFVDEEERGALRTFLRGLRTLDPALHWEATVLSRRGPSSSTPLRADLRARVTFLEPADAAEATLLQAADVLVVASDGAVPAPGLVLRALAAGAVPLASSLAVYEEVLGEGDFGLLFAARDAQTLGAHLSRLIADEALRTRLRDAAAPQRAHLTWERMTDDVEEVYRGLLARRHDPHGRPEIARRLAGRRTIDVDLHMHTDHSMDCATPVEVLLATAREQGLGAIAVTDHNEVSGALEAQAKAAEFGVKIIVGEEVKTASQGEVIGLFLTEKIPRGMTLEETVAEIKRQGGVVYVPHPFDRMHAVPDYEHLLKIIDDVDAIEVYNPRVAIGSFNEEAERFAAKYRVIAGAGSDSHVAQGLGSVRIRMPDFDGPEEFLEALRVAEIHTKPSSLLYVQALKFLETKATPPKARQARKERRVRRATRKA